MNKINILNWPQFDFLINNFYEIVEYKRGRGVYGDRVVLKRSKNPDAIFGEKDKFYDFYYLEANAVKELPRTQIEKINIICKMVCSPEVMNKLCDFQVNNSIEPSEWAIETKNAFVEAKTLDINILNKILIERYKLLGSNFISKLNKHREKQYFLATSEEFNFVSKEHADEQLALL